MEISETFCFFARWVRFFIFLALLESSSALMESQLTAPVRWGIIGCGDVCQVKSGPAFNKSENSQLVAVMRRDVSKVKEFAQSHSVTSIYDKSEDIIQDPNVELLYVATPPGGDRVKIAQQITKAGKPALFEKPLARDAREAAEIVQLFKTAHVPLYVAYYRRHLPFVHYIKSIIENTDENNNNLPSIGDVSGVYITLFQDRHLHTRQHPWHLNKQISGGGKLLDVGSHMLDLVDFLIGPMRNVVGYASQSGFSNSSDVEDLVVGCWKHVLKNRIVPGTCRFNFCSGGPEIDEIQILGTKGRISFPCFGTHVSVNVYSQKELVVKDFENPTHIHKPLVQQIVNDELARRHVSLSNQNSICQSTAESGLRASIVLDKLLNNRSSWKDNYLK